MESERAIDVIDVCMVRRDLGRGCNGCIYKDSRTCSRLKFIYKVDKPYKIYLNKGGTYNERFKEERGNSHRS